MLYKNPEDRRRNALKYKAANYEKVRAWGRKAERKYEQAHPNRPPRKRRDGYQLEWQRDNRGKMHAYDHKSYLKHRKKRIAKTIRWRTKNPEKYMTYRKSISPTKTAAYMRRHKAKKNGYAECTEYPLPPTDKKCAICHRHDARICLDHDHETGKFRGYICRRCNTGLGALGDTVEGLQRALAYLVSHAASQESSCQESPYAQASS